ncbi:MAG: YwdI family protein [Bacillota bacterium]|nr:YwdI family protein [Bacillota bacterium]
MTISFQKLLSKIEEELKLAKLSAKEESLREKVYSIKILCELILDEKQAEHEGTPTFAVTEQQITFTLNPTGKIIAEEDANGESLLDF